MATKSFNNAECVLTSALVTAGISAFGTGANDWDSSTDDAQTTMQFAQIFDGGVTQAEPEIILVKGSLGATILEIHRRGLFGTSIPSPNWPIGSVISCVNQKAIFDCGSAFYNGYPVFCTGWNAAAPSNPGGNAVQFRGGADPEAATDLVIGDVIDDSSGGWDMSPLLGELAAGDLVRIKYIFVGDLMGPGLSATASDADFRPEYRIEFKLDSAPVDNTGWWELPIDSAYYHTHGNMANTDAGRQGFLMIDFMKLV